MHLCRCTQTRIQEEPIVCHNDEELLASNKAGSRWTTVVLQFQLNTVETMLAETMTVVETKTKTITNRSTLAETKTMTNTNKWQ